MEANQMWQAYMKDLKIVERDDLQHPDMATLSPKLRMQLSLAHKYKLGYVPPPFISGQIDGEAVEWYEAGALIGTGIIAQANALGEGVTAPDSTAKVKYYIRAEGPLVLGTGKEHCITHDLLVARPVAWRQHSAALPRRG